MIGRQTYLVASLSEGWGEAVAYSSGKLIHISSTPAVPMCFGVFFKAHNLYYIYGKFGSIPLKDHHFGSIPLLSHLHVSPHESMTCGVHDIYLKFGSFNGIDPIVP
jgi:hypothetical protein